MPKSVEDQVVRAAWEKATAENRRAHRKFAGHVDGDEGFAYALVPASYIGFRRAICSVERWGMNR